jgi:hypothetical protein
LTTAATVAACLVGCGAPTPASKPTDETLRSLHAISWSEFSWAQRVKKIRTATPRGDVVADEAFLRRTGLRLCR